MQLLEERVSINSTQQQYPSILRPINPTTMVFPTYLATVHRWWLGESPNFMRGRKWNLKDIESPLAYGTNDIVNILFGKSQSLYRLMWHFEPKRYSTRFIQSTMSLERQCENARASHHDGMRNGGRP